MYTGQRRTGILTEKDGYLYKYYKGLFTFLYESFSKKAEAYFSVKSATPSTLPLVQIGGGSKTLGELVKANKGKERTNKRASKYDNEQMKE